MANRNLDDLTIAYLLKKAAEAATAALNKAVAVIQTKLDNKVSKSGDTMTGKLTVPSNVDDWGIRIKSATGDRTTTPGAATNPCGITFTDKNGKSYGYVRAYQTADGKDGIWIYGLNDAATAANGLKLMYDSSNNAVVEVTHSAEWRAALGLGSVTSTTTITDIATAGANIKIQSASYANWGKIAQFTIGVKTTAAISAGSGYTVCTLKSGKRPIIFTQGTTNDIKLVGFDTDGTVKIYNNRSSGEAFAIRALYLLA